MGYVIFPLAWYSKLDTAKITSALDTGETLNPSNGAVAKMPIDVAGSSTGFMAIREKWSYSASGIKP